MYSRFSTAWYAMRFVSRLFDSVICFVLSELFEYMKFFFKFAKKMGKNGCMWAKSVIEYR